MSGAPTVAAPVPTAPSSLGAPTTPPGQVETGGPGPGESFDDVLSRQTVGSPHDAYGEKQGTNGAKATGAKVRQLPSSSPSNASQVGIPALHPAVVGTLLTSVVGPGLPASQRPEPSFVAGGQSPRADDRRPPSVVDGAAAHAIAPFPTSRPAAREDGSVSKPGASSAHHADGTGPGETGPVPAGLALGTVAAIGTGSGDSLRPPVASKVMATVSQRGEPAVSQGEHAGPSAVRLRGQPAHVETGAGYADAAAPPPPVTTEGLDAAPSPLTHTVPDVPVAARPTAPGAGPLSPTSTPTAMPHSSITLDVDGLSGSISRPLSDGNGTYTVVVAMHPPDLGHLRAVMSLDGNDLQVSITPQSQAGHDALTEAGDTLKNQLSGNGLNVNVTLRDPGSRSGGDDQQPGDPARGGSALPDGTSATQRPAMPVLVAGQIHLVL